MAAGVAREGGVERSRTPSLESEDPPSSACCDSSLLASGGSRREGSDGSSWGSASPRGSRWMRRLAIEATSSRGGDSVASGSGERGGVLPIGVPGEFPVSLLPWPARPEPESEAGEARTPDSGGGEAAGGTAERSGVASGGTDGRSDDRWRGVATNSRATSHCISHSGNGQVSRPRDLRLSMHGRQ